MTVHVLNRKQLVPGTVGDVFEFFENPLNGLLNESLGIRSVRVAFSRKLTRGRAPGSAAPPESEDEIGD